MHAIFPSPQYEQILHQIANLSTEEQLRLISEISITLRKRIPPINNPTFSQADIIARVKGKYAFVPTSSDLFAQRKAQEIALER